MEQLLSLEMKEKPKKDSAEVEERPEDTMNQLRNLCNMHAILRTYPYYAQRYIVRTGRGVGLVTEEQINTKSIDGYALEITPGVITLTPRHSPYCNSSILT